MMLVVVIVILVLFSVISVLNQISPINKTLAKLDHLRLWPSYSFFAPKPMVIDFRLVYKLVDTQNSEWMEIPFTSGTAPLGKFLIHPDKYYVKGIIDSCSLLMYEYGELSKEKKNYIQASVHYLNLLVLVSDKAQKENGSTDVKVQFAIVSSENKDELKLQQINFLSLSHQF
ncbi:MAG: hypothetical protein COA88_09540 [Kordia sp.]|nr:MAG: hypothetical protein COA88_09540 [Kordia sp.]